MSKKNWITAHNDRNLAAQIAEDFSLNPFVALLLTARGITEPEQIENFLFQRDLFVDPFEITDMDKAVERIGAAVDNYERIMIFGDYDADGVTSTASLYLYLASQGADVGYYIPDGVSEGYGISCGSIREFHSQGVKLIVTVDNGINAVEETALANELGIDVVITDHHKVGDKLPEAVAVVNPHRADCECEYEDYAGVGVVLKLLCALEGDSDTILNEYADLAAIGTLADVVPLTGENRVIVKKGVELLNKRSRTGLEALKMYASVSDKILNSSQVSFSLAPRINAAGRMSSASLAMKLLLCTDRQDAEKLAAELEHANRERHSVEAEIAEKAIEYIEANDEVKYSPVIVVSGEGWHQGVIGIVASRLVSRY
ncbi:MAG TPA: single-stranded-DNA-specific exonuclease RecJ, partial [Ruminococcaceae bacterium]|nr:single-stranded-DNA-specific exonuclease RecJ [Oscillospiraceae bacterium]